MFCSNPIGFDLQADALATDEQTWLIWLAKITILYTTAIVNNGFACMIVHLVSANISL